MTSWPGPWKVVWPPRRVGRMVACWGTRPFCPGRGGSGARRMSSWDCEREVCSRRPVV